jgi:hypothetical protein
MMMDYQKRLSAFAPWTSLRDRIAVTGAAIAGGMLFVNSGYAQWGGMPGNVLVAFSIDGS